MCMQTVCLTPKAGEDTLKLDSVIAGGTVLCYAELLTTSDNTEVSDVDSEG